MKLLVLISLILVLSGCSLQTAAWETVTDSLSQQQPIAYDITVGISESALTDQTDQCKHYEVQEIQVDTHTFQAWDLNSAVQNVSGFEAEKLTILQTSRPRRRMFRI